MATRKHTPEPTERPQDERDTRPLPQPLLHFLAAYRPAQDASQWSPPDADGVRWRGRWRPLMKARGLGDAAGIRAVAGALTGGDLVLLSRLETGHAAPDAALRARASAFFDRPEEDLFERAGPGDGDVLLDQRPT